jgi:hypothetical protein
MSKRSHETVGINVFLTFFLDERRIRIRFQEVRNIWILRIRIHNTALKTVLKNYLAGTAEVRGVR